MESGAIWKACNFRPTPWMFRWCHEPDLWPRSLAATRQVNLGFSRPDTSLRTTTHTFIHSSLVNVHTSIAAACKSVCARHSHVNWWMHGERQSLNRNITHWFPVILRSVWVWGTEREWTGSHSLIQCLCACQSYVMDRRGLTCIKGGQEQLILKECQPTLLGYLVNGTVGAHNLQI